jgi:hypothetical protein
MEYFAILTVELPGRVTATLSSIVTVNGDGTREEIFNYMNHRLITSHGRAFAEANVVFFSAEPNSLGH